jgi:hypothetical protein
LFDRVQNRSHELPESREIGPGIENALRALQPQARHRAPLMHCRCKYSENTGNEQRKIETYI